MTDFFAKLLKSDFMPHGHCFLWRPDLVWLHTGSDTLIALSYFAIPLTLVQLVRKRRDLDFNWMFVMFGVFIMACGMTHLMNVWNIWHSAYRLEGLVKAITAVASVSTALLLFRLLPQALIIPSPAQLRREMEEREKAEQVIRKLNAELGRLVDERTALLKRSDQALQRFAYIASHDLQEPIRTVRSMNQLLARDYKGKLDAKADRYIDFVVEASGRMQKLVSDLLVYARLLTIETPNVEYPVSSEKVVQEIVHDFDKAIQESDATILYRDLPEVLVEEVHLKQIFSNLLSNALKYRRLDKKPFIKVSAEERDGRCFLTVADNGIGIDADYWEQIFVPFRRLHAREYPGSGVGLTICRNIIEQYGGKIGVESEPGSGSVFLFSLPLSNLQYGAHSTEPLEQTEVNAG